MSAHSPRAILLIDDDPAIAEMLGVLVSGFRRGPFRLEHAADYDTGLQRLLHGGYAVCLLDYHLGDRDGLELLREAKSLGSSTPVILLTGSGRDETDLAAMDSGAADYLEKGGLTLPTLERSVCYALEMAGAMAQLREMATHDKLTGVLNRREFDRRLQDEWQRSVRFQRPLALVMLDLDHFKPINDTHGHLAGDAVLRHVATLLARQVREVDCLARYGGDEFALILVETDHSAAQAVAARLCDCVASSPCVLPALRLSIHVEISAGTAARTSGDSSPTDLLAAADGALYAKKRQRGPRAMSV